MIPNFNNQAQPSNSGDNTQAHPAPRWLHKTTTRRHGDEFSPSRNGYNGHVTDFGAPYQQGRAGLEAPFRQRGGFYKEGKVETIETKEYRIYEPRRLIIRSLFTYINVPCKV